MVDFPRKKTGRRASRRKDLPYVGGGVTDRKKTNPRGEKNKHREPTPKKIARQTKKPGR